MSKRNKRKTKHEKRLEQQLRKKRSRYQRSEQGREDARKASLRKRLRVPGGFLFLGMLIIGGLMLYYAPPAKYTPNSESPQTIFGFLIFGAGLGGLISVIWPDHKNSLDDRPSEFPSNRNSDHMYTED